MMKKQMANLLLVLLAVILSGCASFQGNQLKRISDYPSVRRKKTIHATLSFKGKLNGKPWTENDARNQSYLEQRCLDHLESCGMFSVVPGDQKTTDLQLHVALINEKETRKKMGKRMIRAVPRTRMYRVDIRADRRAFRWRKRRSPFTLFPLSALRRRRTL